jgi:hypothetical protein
MRFADQTFIGGCMIMLIFDTVMKPIWEEVLIRWNLFLKGTLANLS